MKLLFPILLIAWAMLWGTMATIFLTEIFLEFFKQTTQGVMK